MEVELTSARDDGTWTWRAAGARKPKGVLEGHLLTAPAKVGDVLRVEAEVEVDGITVVSVLPPKATRPEPARLELIARPEETPLVTSSTTGREARGERRRPDRESREGREGKAARPAKREGARRPRATPDPTRARSRPSEPRPTPTPSERPARPRSKRPQARRTHRDALLA